MPCARQCAAWASRPPRRGVRMRARPPRRARAPLRPRPEASSRRARKRVDNFRSFVLRSTHAWVRETSAMLTEDRLRELLDAGHRTSDAEFAKHMVENMSRTVYLMALFLAERQHGNSSSIELQERIGAHLKKQGVLSVPLHFNPVDWFSAQLDRILETRS